MSSPVGSGQKTSCGILDKLTFPGRLHRQPLTQRTSLEGPMAADNKEANFTEVTHTKWRRKHLQWSELWHWQNYARF